MAGSDGWRCSLIPQRALALDFQEEFSGGGRVVALSLGEGQVHSFILPIDPKFSE
jgi:hypothetical protein